MRQRLILAPLALACGSAALTAGARTAGDGSLYTRAATQSCLSALPNSIVGLPPATPPVPPELFVYPLTRDALSTWAIGQSQRRPHTQLGAWYGGGHYEGIILSFFKSVADARESLKSLVGLYGGKLVRNVVLTWDQKQVPSRTARDTVVGCLRSGPASKPAAKRPPPATLATFTGGWGGHTRRLSITARGRGDEVADSGCCTRVYNLQLQIVSTSGTLTRATAVYRVMSFKRYEAGVKMLHVGDVGKLVLKNGIVTNNLTDDFFCSDPAWGATGACGA